MSKTGNKKVVVFVDGENLVMRYQEMLATGWVPKTFKAAVAGGGTTDVPIVSHVSNCFVWSPGIFRELDVDLLRINYYTSVVGDGDRHTEPRRPRGERAYLHDGSAAMESYSITS